MLHNPPHNPLYEGHAGEAQRVLATQVFGRKGADSSSISTGVDIEQIRAFLPHPRPIPTPIMFGGTGETTALRAFNALSPTTTTGDMIYQSGVNDVRLAIGIDNQYLKVFSGIPTWVDLDASDMTVGTLSNSRLDADLAAIGNLATTEGFYRKTGAGTVTVHKSNLAAAVAPTANDDSGDGYSIGSIWIDTVTDMSYTCVDATVAAAVWNGTMGGGMNALLDGSVHSDTIAQAASLNAVVVGTGANLWSKVVGPATWGFLCGDNGTGGPIAFTNTLPNDQTIIFGSGDAKIYGDSGGDLHLSVPATGFNRMLYNAIEFFSFGTDTATGTKPAMILRDAAGAEYGHIALANTADMLFRVAGASNKFFWQTASTTQMTLEDNKITWEAGASDVGINFGTSGRMGFEIAGTVEVQVRADEMVLLTGGTTVGFGWTTSGILDFHVGGTPAMSLAATTLTFENGVNDFQFDFGTDGILKLTRTTTENIHFGAKVMTFQNTTTTSQKFSLLYDTSSILKVFLGDPATSTNEVFRIGADVTTWKPAATNPFSITGTDGTGIFKIASTTQFTILDNFMTMENSGTVSQKFTMSWDAASLLKFFLGDPTSAGNEMFRLGDGILTFKPNLADSFVIDASATNAAIFKMEAATILTVTKTEVTFAEEAVFAATKGAIFNSGSAAASVEGAMWNDSTRRAIVQYANGIIQYPVKALYIMCADKLVNYNDNVGETFVSLANTTTPGTTHIGTTTLPADFLTVGKTIRVSGRGYLSLTNPSGNTFRWAMYVGGVSIKTANYTPAASLASTYFEFRYELTCRTTGAPGTIYGQGHVGLLTGSSTYTYIEVGNTTTDGVTTTGTVVVEPRIAFDIGSEGAGSAAASVTMTNLVIESIG